MVSVDKQALISQLCTASKLQGKELEEYRTRLNKMSETELSALISGDKKGDNVDTVELNHSQGTNKTEITKKEAEDLSIQNIESNANQAIQMIDSQDDGNISETYNKLKEKFNSDLAKSNVEKVAYKQLETAYFLKEAQANNLTYKEYYEQRKELLYKTFPGVERFNDKQKAGLKRMIDTLSPQQVLQMQDKVLSLSEKGSEGYDDSVRNFLNDFKTETTETTDSVIVQNKEFGMKVKTKPKDKFELADGERLMTFDEVYSLEQGVKFNKDNIQKYNESAAKFAFLSGVNAKREGIHQTLDESLRLVQGNNSFGADKNIIESSNKRLKNDIYSAMVQLYGNDIEKINQGLKELTGGDYSFKQGENGIELVNDTVEKSKFALNSDTFLPQIAEKILSSVDTNYETMLGGKKLEDYANEMAADYKSAYGEKDAANLAQSYVQDQEGVVQNIRAGVEFVGMGVMVGGMILFPPAALAGGALASFGGVGVELYNESTKDSVNQERTGELKRELVTNALLMGVGFGAGKAGSSVKALLTAKNAPKLAAVAADIGTDSTIGLLGDLALTGQVNLEGEGFSQFMALVAGHRGKIVQGIKNVKDNIKAKFGPDARQMPDGTVIRVNKDGSTTVLQEGVNDGVGTHPAKTDAPRVGVNDGAGTLRTATDTGVKSEGVGQSDLAARLDNAQSREDFIAIRDEIKNMPNGAEKLELQKQYLNKWNEFSQDPSRHEIKMEYKEGVNEGGEAPGVNKGVEVPHTAAETPTFKTPEELETFLKNQTVKDESGNDVKKNTKISLLLLVTQHAKTQEGRDAIVYLTGFKDGDKLRFSYNEIKVLVDSVQTQEGREAIEYLANIKDGDNPRFNGFEIRDLIKYAQTQENRDAIQFLANIKVGDKPRFRGYEIKELVELAKTQESRDAIKFLANIKDGDKPRFDGYDIANLIEPSQTQENREVIEYLANIKDGDKPRFSGYAIRSLIKPAQTQEGREAIEYLANIKDGDKPRFSGSDIVFLVDAAQTKEGKEAIEYLVNIKDGNKPRFGGNRIKTLVEPAQTQEGREVIEYLASIKYGDIPRFNVDDIRRLAESAKTPEGRKFIKKLIDEKEDDILDEINEQNIKLAEDLCNRSDFPKDKIAEIVRATNEQNIKLAEQLCNNPDFSKERILEMLSNTRINSDIIKDQNIDDLMAKVEAQRAIVKANPEKYVNGEYPDSQAMLNEVDSFFDKQLGNLMVLSAVYDKEAVNNLLRMRFDDTEEYIESLENFNSDDIQLLKELSNSSNIDGKPFMPTQKIEFIDLINAYKDNNLSMDKMHEMLDSGKIDVAQLNVDLFRKILKNSGMSDEEIASTPIEKLTGWDTKFAHMLSKEIQSGRDDAFFDILRAGNLEPDFIKYIHDENNVYGKVNAQTKAQFDEMGMNYDNWVKPSKQNEVHFVSKDANQEHLSQISAQITEDMNTLMQTPVKGFLKKQFSNFIKGDEFVIPNEYLTSKSKLEGFVKKLTDTTEQGQLYQVWKRAQGNAVNPDPKRAATAKNTLTVLDHLNQRLDDISKAPDTKATKTLDLTVKMWDRNPQKDIFQGNYSTCCIGMGNGNGSAMPHYIMNTAYNMIELVDNTSGKTVGNALCYFIKGENGKPAFIIDNIEINNSVKPSSEVGIQLRNSMVEYASRVSRDVTGNDDTPIYMSSSYNDVPCDDLARHIETISFLGDIDNDNIYMDLYKGWIDKDKFTSSQELLKLK